MSNIKNYEEEYLKCKRDFIYFCENYVKIQHSTKGLIPFKLFDYQKRVVKQFTENRYSIVLKFRQGGLTTVSVVWAAWKAMFYLKENVILVVSITDREAKVAGRIVDILVENLPEWLKPRMPRKPNAHEKNFLDTSGRIYFKTVKSARGLSLSLLIIDEAAYIKGMAEEHWAALLPTLSGGGKCIAISTPNGMANWYAYEYHKALKNESEFSIIEIDVSEHPDYNNPKWIESQKNALGDKRFGQEILRQFAAEGDTFISNKLINEINLDSKRTPPVSKKFAQWDSSKDKEKGALWIWESPQPGRNYILSCDTSEGVGLDNSAFVILDMETCEQVAEFYSNSIPAFNFAGIVHQIATAYNYALLVIEKKGAGIATLERIERELLYTNLWGSTTKNRGQHRYGFDTGKSSRSAMCDVLQAALINRRVKIKSIRLVKELTTFIFNQSKHRAEAAKGTHDDLILSLAIALYILNNQFAAISKYTPHVQEIPQEFAFNKSTKENILQELKDYINNENDNSFNNQQLMSFGKDVLDTGFMSSNLDQANKDEPSKIGKEMYESRENHSVLREFNW